MAQLFDEAELLDRVDNDLAFLADTVQMLETDGRALMVELKTAVLEEGASIHLGSADGPLLQIGALPYALIDPT